MLICALLMGCGGLFEAHYKGNGIIVDVWFDDENKIVGQTNLPDGTNLLLEIKHPRQDWTDEQIVTVRDGRFISSSPLRRTVVSQNTGFAEISIPSGIYVVSWRVLMNTNLMVVKETGEITLEQ